MFEGLSFDCICKDEVYEVQYINIAYKDTHKGELNIPEEVCMTLEECWDMLELQSMNKKIMVDWDTTGGVITIPIPLTRVILRCELIEIPTIGVVKDEILWLKEENTKLNDNLEVMDKLNISLQSRVDQLEDRVGGLLEEINEVNSSFSKGLQHTDIPRFQHVNVLFGKTLYEHLLIRARYPGLESLANQLIGVIFSSPSYIRELPICNFVEGVVQEGFKFNKCIRMSGWMSTVFDKAKRLNPGLQSSYKARESYKLSLEYFGTFSGKFLDEIDRLYFDANPSLKNSKGYKSFVDQAYELGLLETV